MLAGAEGERYISSRVNGTVTMPRRSRGQVHGPRLNSRRMGKSARAMIRLKQGTGRYG